MTNFREIFNDHIGAHIFYAMRDGVNWAPGALNGRGDHPPLAN